MKTILKQNRLSNIRNRLCRISLNGRVFKGLNLSPICLMLDEFGLLRISFPYFLLSKILRSGNLQADCVAGPLKLYIRRFLG